jgi:hypothetical protein
MYNHLLQGGYFAMPSARMGAEGEIGVGYAYVPPYRNYNLRFQITDRLEISGSYRIFHGIPDPVLSPHGFGDFSDKGANFKFAILLPEDSDYQLPGIAIGYEDFIGTKAFHARYIVLTQVFLKQNLEISLGYGARRIRGLFGGIQWMPFRQSGSPYLKGLSFVAEYDAIPYHKETIEKHPHGRVKRSPINFGIKYRLLDRLDFSLSYIRGHALAFSASTFYNFGTTRGFLPKINDPLLYTAPVNLEPLGIRRPESALAQDLAFAFREQGMDLLEVRLFYTECFQKGLRLRIINDTFRHEKEVRERLSNLLAALIPSDIAEVIVIVEADEGFSIQQYPFKMAFVRQFLEQEMGRYELKVVTPLQEVSCPDYYCSRVLYKRRKEWWNIELTPKTHTIFGSSSGKFKCTLGVHVGLNGFLWDDIYYSLLLGLNLYNDLENVHDVDILNPSQLINVRTDLIRYYKQKGITVDEAYLQKNWTLGKGWYSRLAAGYFEEAYGGAAAECLYYPVNACWAAGFESAVLKKRNYRGLGFSSTIRKLKGFDPTHRKFTGYQYFLNLYFDWKCAQLDFKIAAGKFLARDHGIRFEMSRYFNSGLRITFWYTLTDGHDKVNGHTYHDKGILFSMPFDILYTHSERAFWEYGMSAWLRDVGFRAYTGRDLYDMIRDLRE